MTMMLQTQPTVNQIATLLIPVAGRHLVLPNVNVAEIIPYREPVAPEAAPDWYLGRLAWRATEVPLVIFESINGESYAGGGRNRRIVILNNVTGDPALRFCGVIAEAMPRLQRLLAEEIITDTQFAPGPAELARVFVNGEPASIPDVAYIQRQLLKL